MSFLIYAPYLSPEYPKFTDSEDRVGNEYRYVLPDDVYRGSTPVTGELWEDGRTVREHQRTPSLGNSGWSEVTLSTVYQRTATSLSTGSTPDDIKYSLRAMVAQIELSLHPEFLPGGDSDLYTDDVTSGAMTDKPYVFCLAWENEPNQVIRGKRQFYPRDGDGFATGAPISVPGGAATAYVKLRLLGYTTFDFYYPVWERVSTYAGEDPPVSGSWGQYIETSNELLDKVPDNVKTTYPQWVKTADDIDRVGNKARWQRVERAIGYPKVYFDVDELNPAENALP
jgi:hypothetical protein